MIDRSSCDVVSAEPTADTHVGREQKHLGHDVIAEVVRSGLVESRHHGSIVTFKADGTAGWSIGDVLSPMFPRSCNKPIQAVAMLRTGLSVGSELLALASGSHSGEPFHLAGVREILRAAGLDESALQTPSDYPHDERAGDAYRRRGHEPTPIAMGCSGKHAAMLATCVTAGWATSTYLDPRHPLQERIRGEVERMSGERVTVTGVDGCGAPLYAVSLTGLARAYRNLLLAESDTPERLVADAIRQHPEWVSGSRRFEADLLRSVPGAVGKSGAEGCYAMALPDGRSLALKITDGADRAWPVVVTAVLHQLLPGMSLAPGGHTPYSRPGDAGHVEVQATITVATP